MRRCLALLAFLSVTGVALPARAQSSLPADEARVLQMINVTRRERGLVPLAARPDLVDLARAQSRRMVARGDIFHNPRLGEDLTQLGLPWLRAGENVGVGPDVEHIEQAFLESPGHLANIVRPEFAFLGVGVLEADGRVWVTQVFAQLQTAPAAAVTPRPLPPPSTPQPVRPPVAVVKPPPTAVSVPQRSRAPRPAPAIRGGITEPGSLFAVAPRDGPSLFALVNGLIRRLAGV